MSEFKKKYEGAILLKQKQWGVALAGVGELKTGDKVTALDDLRQGRVKKGDQGVVVDAGYADNFVDVKFNGKVETMNVNQIRKLSSGKDGVALEIFQGLYKGVEYKVRPEGGGFYWQVGKTKGGKIFKEERDAINACKQYIESIK